MDEDYYDCYDEDARASPLMEACKHGHDPIVRILWDAGANAKWQSYARNGDAAILEACTHGHLSTVQMLIHQDQGLLEIVEENGWTPWHRAVFARRLDIVRFLLNRGANVHATAKDGSTTLMQACYKGDLEIVRLLIAAGVEVEARDGRQRTVLHHAVLRKRIEVRREIIVHHNANIFAVDEDGSTPFDRAVIIKFTLLRLGPISL